MNLRKTFQNVITSTSGRGDTLVRFLFVIEMEEATGDLATALVALKECRDFQQGSELRYGKIYEGTFVSGRRS